MLTEQRHLTILDELQLSGRVLARELAERLAVSEDTIRRDLRDLAQRGALQRVHGGALPVSPALANLARRGAIALDEKRALGRAAAALIADGQLVFVDGGTSTLSLVQQLPVTLRATIATHSPVIAAALIEHPSVEVLMLGGRLFKHSGVAVGAGVAQAVQALRADCCFLGVTGVDAAFGLSTGDFEEAQVKALLMAQAAETVLMASSDKLGKVSPFRVAPLAALSTLIVTPQASADALASLRRPGLDILVARD
ncbi:DeoR/GlpR family DNA-binding transcription regulator [Roseateles sp. DC23W]|uniref:DeoR/GlpR family DNA-binding transcription regulator n=1 Tax=Pelomonas dachongensis TaxID=3299029 RepID=A0ABW7ENW5_9BURK